MISAKRETQHQTQSQRREQTTKQENKTEQAEHKKTSFKPEPSTYRQIENSRKHIRIHTYVYDSETDPNNQTTSRCY